MTNAFESELGAPKKSSSYIHHPTEHRDEIAFALKPPPQASPQTSRRFPKFQSKTSLTSS
jgi:hypothetical protein